MENGPGLKMYFLFKKMVIFQPAMLVYQRVIDPIKTQPFIYREIYQNRFASYGIVTIHSFVKKIVAGCRNKSRWWFQAFFTFTPTWGYDPI